MKSPREAILRSVMAIFVVLLFVVLSGLVLLTPRDRAVLFQPEKTLLVNDVKRHYIISVPKHSKPSKLVIGLHGFGDSSRKFAYYTALHNTAGNDTIVVYPSAVRPSSTAIKPGWNAGFCCGSGFLSGTDDVGFIQKLIDELSGRYGIASRDTFIVGFSNGAFMAQKFAAEKPNSIGGVSVSSGTIGTKTNSLHPSTPVPILLMHSEDDKTVPMLGGPSATNPDFDWLPYKKTLSVWQINNGSTAKTSTIVYPDTGHIWRGWRILNVWHHKPQASIESIKFLKGL